VAHGRARAGERLTCGASWLGEGARGDWKGGADKRARGVRERRATRERMLATGRAGRAGPCGEEEKRAVLLGFAGKGSGPPGLGCLGWAGRGWAKWVEEKENRAGRV
jgi:hypothetical protein